jgi:hypothetical protein
MNKKKTIIAVSAAFAVLITIGLLIGIFMSQQGDGDGTGRH